MIKIIVKFTKRTQKSYRRARYIKKGRGVLCKPHKLKYSFIKEYSSLYAVRKLCKVMQVHHSGYYQWLTQPISTREQENTKLTIHIKELFKKCNGIYGYRNIHKDLIASGIIVNKKRVARLMIKAKLYGVGTYKRKPKHKAGAKHKAYTNHLQQCFIANKPNETWVSDITYIRTYEGWLYLAPVIDLFSRKVIGWDTSHRMTTPLVLNAMKMATQRISNSNTKVILHSDQGSQYSSYE